MYSRLTDRVTARLTELRDTTGVIGCVTTNESYDGRMITVTNPACPTFGVHRCLNFGSCCYLGLEHHEEVKKGAIEAVRNYGVVFTTSRTWVGVGLNTEVENAIRHITGGYVNIFKATTIAHTAALPCVTGRGDVIVSDRFVHASVTAAVAQVASMGRIVKRLPHSDMAALERILKDPEHKDAKAIWYLADGTYSSDGDTAPMRELHALQERYPRLHVYVDDAHGFGVSGWRGRGPMFELVPQHPRTVVAISLCKAVGCGGGAIVTKSKAIYDRIRYHGGPQVFGSPLPVPVLGALKVALRILASPEGERLRAKLLRNITLFNYLAKKHDIPMLNFETNAVKFIGVGPTAATVKLIRALLADGYWTCLGTWPSRPRGQDGLRITITASLTKEDITGFAKAIKLRLAEVMKTEKFTMQDISATFGLPRRNAAMKKFLRPEISAMVDLPRKFAAAKL